MRSNEKKKQEKMNSKEELLRNTEEYGLEYWWKTEDRFLLEEFLEWFSEWFC